VSESEQIERNNMKTYEELIEQIRVNLNDDERFNKKLEWIKEMVESYSKFLEIDKRDILQAFEDKRSYWSANYYQEANFPKLDDKVKVFETQEELMEAVKSKKFICPACGQTQTSPYECNSGYKDKDGKICNWKSYGLFETLGKGFRFTVKDKFLENPIVDNIFMPVEFIETKYNPDFKEDSK
jgi:DNA-directed RNA polymerase subunit M/transcription elongation factor TFIIS